MLRAIVVIDGEKPGTDKGTNMNQVRHINHPYETLSIALMFYSVLLDCHCSMKNIHEVSECQNYQLP